MARRARLRLRLEALDDRINPTPVVARLSADKFFIDKDPTPALTSAYVGYQIQGDGVVHKDVYAQIGGFSAGIGLSAGAPTTVRLGDLSAAGKLNAYFYLTGPESATPKTYTVTFYSGLPSLGNVLATYGETLTAVEDTIQAAANKFNSGSVVSSGSLAIGSMFNLVLNGSTGTVGSPIIAYTPASLATWLPSAFQIVTTSLTFSSGDLAGAVVPAGALFYQPAPTATSNSDYTITYTLRAINATSTATALTPLTNIGSGTQVKHTDTGSWSTLQPIPAVVNNLTVGMTAGAATGGVSTVTLTVTNAGSVAASLDQLRAVLPAGITYVPGSATLGGAAYVNPVVSGGDLTWSDNYSVPAAGTLTLTFQVTVPATGSYQLSGFARIGDTQIDTTAPTTDSAPATATVAADATPPDTTLTATPPLLSNSASATFAFTGSDAGGSGVAGFEYRLDGGAWTSATTPLTLSGLSNGSHTFDVRAIDNVGNVDPTPATHTWTVDTIAPGVPAITGVSPDTGTSPTDRVTKTGGLTVSGTAEPNATVTVFDNTTPIGTTTANGAGNWSLAVTLSEGTHPLTATATDAAGNTSAASAPAGVRVDLTAPGTAITGQPTALSGSAAAAFTFAGSDPSGSGVAGFEYRIDGGAWAAAASPLTLTGLADGAHTFDVRASDVAGNTDATPATYSWTVDTTAPGVPAITGITPDTGTLPTDRVTNTGTLTVTGTAEANANVTVFDNGAPIGTTTANGSGNWSLAVTLAQGMHPLTATATDAVGNTSAASVPAAVVVDLTAPDTTITAQPAGLSASAAATFSFAGTDGLSGVAGFQYRLDGGSWTPATSPLALSGLADGAHTFDVRATDVAGNTDTTPATYSWTVDTAAPGVPTISGITPDTGASPTDRVTNTSALTVSGTAEPNSTVAVYDNGTLLGTTAADGTGSWSLAVTLAEGAHPLTATATDATGNVSAASVAAGVLVDLTAPTTGIGSGPTTVSGSASATFTFTGADALSGVAGFEYRLDGGAWTTATSPLTLTGLSDGAHSFAVRAVDLAGNPDPSGAAGYSWTVDTAAPGVPAITGITPDTGASPTDRVTNTGTLTVTGTAEANSTVTVYDNGSLLGTTTATGTGNWSLPVSLAPGAHPLTATATDAANNTSASSAPAGVTVDTVAPVVGGSTAAATNAAPVVAVTASDAGSGVPNGTAVAVDVDLDGNGDFAGPGEAGYGAGTLAGGAASVTLPLPAEGVYAYRVRLADVAGNVGTGATGTFRVDTTAPDTTILSGPPAIAATGGASFTFAGSDPNGSGVAGFEYRIDGGNWTGTTSPHSLTGLPDGPHTFEVRATDAAGNTDPTPATYTWTVDTGAPAAPVITGITPDTGASPTDRVTGTSALTVTGTAEPNATVAVYDNGTLLGTASANGAGVWALPTTLAEGSHPLTATATDAAGNTSAASTPAAVVVDLTAPDTTLTGQPAPVSGSGSATFTFTGTDALSGVAGFEYRLDGGAWTTATTPLTLAGLADGAHTFAVRAVDLAGNPDPDTGGSGYSWTVDTAAPSAPAITSITPDTGTSATDRVTNTGTLTVTGTAEPNAAVTVYDGGALLGTTTANGTGGWTLAVSLAEGTHPLTATATDAAGNTSAASAPAGVRVDLTAPDTTISGQPTALSGSAAAAFTFAGSDPSGSGIAGFEYRIDGGTWAAATSPLTLTNLGDGAHTFDVRATDVAGNTDATPATYSWTVDTTAPSVPAVTGFSPDTGATGDGITSATTLTLTGTAEPNSTVTLIVDGAPFGTTVADAAGNWSLAGVGPLPEGPRAFTATATDAAGNTSAAPAALTVTIDTAAPGVPVITGITPDTGASPTDRVTNTSALTVSGTAEPNATVTVYDNGTLLGTATANGAGIWSLTVTLAEGSHPLTAAATDAASNTSAASAPAGVLVDLTAPTTGIGSGPAAVSGSPSATFTFTGADALSGVAGFEYRLDGGAWISATSPLTLTGLADGAHSFAVRAIDLAGNPDPSGAAGYTWTVDTAAPGVPAITGITPDTGASPTDRLTNTGTLTVVGTAEPNATVTVYDNGTLLGTTTADGSGNWSLPTSLTETTHPLTATATDAGGNTSGSSTPAPVEVDLTAPAVAGVTGPAAAATPTPTITGTAEPGSTVAVFDNGNLLGTTTADGAGNWTFIPTTPLAEGGHTLTSQATDPAGNVGPVSGPVSLTVSTAVAVLPAVTPDWTVGGPDYPTRFEAAGTLAPFTFTVKPGTALPPGLALDPGTGDVTGSPTAAGDYSFVVVATDPVGNTAERAFTVHINPPLTSPLGDLTVLPYEIVQDAAAIDLGVVGGTGSIHYAVTAGALPPGLALDPGTGRVSGTPTTRGSYFFTVTATDGVNAVFSKDYRLDVIDFPLLTSGSTGAPSLGGATVGEIGTRVNLYGILDGNVAGTATPFAGFTGEVLVAYGDVTGDRVPEIITTPGLGGGPRVVVMDIETGVERASFFAYDPTFRGGLTVAVGDVTGDGVADFVTGAGAGGAGHVKVFDGRTHAELASFLAFDPAFRGGARVAVADVTGDGTPDIIVGAGAGGAPHVKVFDGRTYAELASWYAFEDRFRGGVHVAGGDVYHTGLAVVVAGAGAEGGPRVSVFETPGGVRRTDYFAYDVGFGGGVRVAVNDADHDGQDDLITGAGPGGGPHVRTWDAARGGATELASFFAFDPADSLGVYV